jgi:TolB-like protein
MSYSLIVRTPRGTEYWYADALPDVGEVIERRGVRYVVARCDSDEDRLIVVVTLAERGEDVPVLADGALRLPAASS